MVFLKQGYPQSSSIFLWDFPLAKHPEIWGISTEPPRGSSMRQMRKAISALACHHRGVELGPSSGEHQSTGDPAGWYFFSCLCHEESENIRTLSKWMVTTCYLYPDGLESSIFWRDSNNKFNSPIRGIIFIGHIIGIEIWLFQRYSQFCWIFVDMSIFYSHGSILIISHDIPILVG